jgi:hypothetical protein
MISRHLQPGYNLALVALCAFGSVAELDYIPLINFTEVGTLFIPAE